MMASQDSSDALASQRYEIACVLHAADFILRVGSTGMSITDTIFESFARLAVTGWRSC